MVTTYLEARYVDRAKLNGLLQALFGQSYSVEVGNCCCAAECRPSSDRQLMHLSDFRRYDIGRGLQTAYRGKILDTWVVPWLCDENHYQRFI